MRIDRLCCLLILLAAFHPARSSTYYFSDSMGDDSRTNVQAQNINTPWRSLGKLNAIMNIIGPGDSVLLKRGDVFEGFITITVSGSSAQPITFSAYGQGNRPVITGFTNVTGWSTYGNGIWQATLNTNEVNIFLFNGLVTPKGRYPNTGFLTMESVSQNQFTDDQLPASPNWTGGEAVIRKNRWVLDRDPITSHNGNTVNIAVTSGYQPSQGYGYFIQHHLLTLDREREWYFDAQDKKIYCHFGNRTPSQIQVRAATGGDLVTANGQGHHVFNELRFEGANANAFQLMNTQQIRVSNCEIVYTGVNAVNAGSTNGLQIENCNIDHTNNIAVNANNCSNVTISNNGIHCTGIFPGMGQNNSGSYEGIILNGNNNIIELNTIDSTGYIPVTFGGNSVTIRNNLITNFAFIKDDGGGIYTWNNQPGAPENTGRIIIGNIILNGIGAGPGTDDPGSARVHGIYMDDNSTNVAIVGNTVAHCGQFGIFIHNARDMMVRSNTVYNNLSQLVLSHDNIAPNAPVSNIRSTDNILFSKLPTQLTAEYRSIRNDINSFGYFDSNYYVRPIDDDLTIYTSYQNNGAYYNRLVDLEAWQVLFNKDLHSHRSPVSIAGFRLNSLVGNNKYQNGGFNNDIGGLYVYSSANNTTASWTNTAGLDNGALKVQFSAQSGAYNQAYVIIGVGAVTANKNYVVRFSLRGSNEYKNMQVFLRQSQSPYHDLSERKFMRVKAGRTENEFLLTASANESDASLVFELEEMQEALYFDNIQLYEATATITNPGDSIRFEYNASLTPKTVALDGAYIDARRNIYNGSITLSPYASAVLVKKLDLNTLPLQFISFSGQQEDVVINLRWVTSTDMRTGSFEVERSGTGNNFVRIGSIPATATGPPAYRFTDAQPLQGNNYYRLRYTQNNRQLYSNIIAVPLRGLRPLQELQNEDLLLRPNPAMNTLEVLVHALPVTRPVTLSIHTSTGNLIRSYPVYLINNRITLDISFLPAGTYTMRFFSDGKRLARNFIKI